MKEDWLNKIRERMTDYEIDEPDNLWENIEARRTATSFSAAKSGELKKWMRRSIAAAIIATVISTGIYFVYVIQDFPQTNHLSTAPDKSVKETATNREENLPGIKLSKNLLSGNTLSANISSAVNSVLPTGDHTRLESTKSGNSIEPSEEEKESIDGQKVSEETPAPEKEWSHTAKENNHIASIHPREKESKNISVSVFSTGGTGAVLNSNTKTEPQIATLGPNNSDWKDSPMLGILLFNKGKEIKTDIKHRLPIRAGISFTYNLTDRFALESGLCYTNLTSDIKKGSDDHYYIGEQTLHYIGIPLNLKYRFFSWKRIELYSSIGALAEKCVSAKLHKEFILDNQNKGEESEKFSEKPMQWAANVSVGVQCNIIKSMGIFAEPGISYYFNDGTDLQTIYKEKPLNFNLNLGIRFTFGK